MSTQHHSKWDGAVLANRKMINPKYILIDNGNAVDITSAYRYNRGKL